MPNAFINAGQVMTRPLHPATFPPQPLAVNGNPGIVPPPVPAQPLPVAGQPFLPGQHMPQSGPGGGGGFHHPQGDLDTQAYRAAMDAWIGQRRSTLEPYRGNHDHDAVRAAKDAYFSGRPQPSQFLI